MKILGISAFYHDSAASLVVDRKNLAAGPLLLGGVGEICSFPSGDRGTNRALPGPGQPRGHLPAGHVPRQLGVGVNELAGTGLGGRDIAGRFPNRPGDL